MRIRDVACHVLEAPLSRRFGWSLAETDRRTAMLVEVVAEDGTTCGSWRCRRTTRPAGSRSGRCSSSTGPSTRSAGRS